MKRLALVAMLVLAAAVAAHADEVGTVTITKDYNKLEVQDGATTYKVSIEQLKKILRNKAKEAYKDGDAEVEGTIEIKDQQQQRLYGSSFSVVNPVALSY